jgi:hypothetical protein
MALEKPSNRTYLKVVFGSLRVKATKDTPEAVARELKDKSVIYETVYRSLAGVLEDVKFQSHDEYGNSWTLHMKDGEQLYAIQIQENSRYGGDFLKKLPNLRKGGVYKITPYEFERDGKKRAGLSIFDDGDQKVESFYQKFEGNDADGWKVTNLHGFPDFEGSSKDKDDLKIYFTRVIKFLRTKAQEHLHNAFFDAPMTKEEPIEAGGAEDDLPF